MAEPVAVAQEEEDVIDDWENADIDDMAQKISTKAIAPATSKVIVQENEDEEEQAQSKSNVKAQQKMKKEIKQAKQEEEKGGDVFAAMESQGSKELR